MIARQKIQVGIGHAGRTVADEEADTTFLAYDGAQLLTEAGGLALGCPGLPRRVAVPTQVAAGSSQRGQELSWPRGRVDSARTALPRNLWASEPNESRE